MAPPDLTRDPAYLEGLHLFNEGSFFECHEVLEQVWKQSPPAHRFFLQAIIHFAIALYQQERGNLEGGRRQIGKAARKLAGYLPRYGGLDTWTLYRQAVTFQAAFEGGTTPPPAPRLKLDAPNSQGRPQPA